MLGVKNYSLQDVNKDLFLNNTNLKIVQKYTPKLNEEYFNKIFISKKWN